jgi:SOS-response transcriptional repressor LexA
MHQSGMRIEEIRRHNLIWLIRQEYQGVDVNLARALGIQASQISRIFSNNPTHRRNIGRGLAEKIEEQSGKPNGWMDLVHDFVDYTTTESRTRYALTEKGPGRSRSNVATGPTIKRVVPLIEWKWVGESLEALEDHPVQASYLCPVECSEQTFVLRVTGISMEPRFRNGELIFVDPAVKPEHGKFVIVRTDSGEDPIFRQLIIEGRKHYLQALNEDWPERVTEVTPTAQFAGVVIFKGETI